MRVEVIDAHRVQTLLELSLVKGAVLRLIEFGEGRLRSDFRALECGSHLHEDLVLLLEHRVEVLQSLLYDFVLLLHLLLTLLDSAQINLGLDTLAMTLDKLSVLGG